nr:sugar ABC transporter permease [Thermus scotoductus]
MRTTLLYTLVVNALNLSLGLLVAHLLNRPLFLRGLWRSLILLPWVVPSYVVGLLWGFMWLKEGVINHLLVDVLGLLPQKPHWLIGPLTFVAIVLPTVWRSWPFVMVTYLAALQAIPQELYEAAMVDGATPFQAFHRVILPLALPGLAATAVYIFLTAWDELLFAQVLTTEATATIPVGIRNFVGNYQNRYDLVMAAAPQAPRPLPSGWSGWPFPCSSQKRRPGPSPSWRSMPWGASGSATGGGNSVLGTSDGGGRTSSSSSSLPTRTGPCTPRTSPKPSSPSSLRRRPGRRSTPWSTICARPCRESWSGRGSTTG